MEKVIQNVRRGLATLALAGVLTGCNGEVREPEDRSVYRSNALSYSFIGNGQGSKWYSDIDGDGDIDVIYKDRTYVYWVAEDMVEEAKENFAIDRVIKTPRMSPEIQEAATRLVTAYGDLRYFEALEQYEDARTKEEKK
jgi:hypothetical protein